MFIKITFVGESLLLISLNCLIFLSSLCKLSSCIDSMWPFLLSGCLKEKIAKTMTCSDCFWDHIHILLPVTFMMMFNCFLKPPILVWFHPFSKLRLENYSYSVTSRKYQGLFSLSMSILHCFWFHIYCPYYLPFPTISWYRKVNSTLCPRCEKV